MHGTVCIAEPRPHLFFSLVQRTAHSPKVSPVAGRVGASLGHSCDGVLDPRRIRSQQGISAHDRLEALLGAVSSPLAAFADAAMTHMSPAFPERSQSAWAVRRTIRYDRTTTPRRAAERSIVPRTLRSTYAENPASPRNHSIGHKTGRQG